MFLFSASYFSSRALARSLNLLTQIEKILYLHFPVILVKTSVKIPLPSYNVVLGNTRIVLVSFDVVSLHRSIAQLLMRLSLQFRPGLYLNIRSYRFLHLNLRGLIFSARSIACISQNIRRKTQTLKQETLILSCIEINV